MESPKRNKTLFIDKEALATLSMLKEGIFSPVDKLMNEKTAKEVDKTSRYKGKYFPFSFILAPAGKRNEEVLKSAQKGDILHIVVDGALNGELQVEEVFPIDKKKRVEMIFSTSDMYHPGVIDILNRLGNYAVSGEFKIHFESTKEVKEQIQAAKEEIGAQKTTAMMLSGRPLHRAHERMIRSALESNDLVVLFLLKPYREDNFDYQMRLKAIKYYINNYQPKNRVLVVPFENTYIFAGYNNILLDAIAAKNFGCDSLTIGENHAGIGIYYDQHGTNYYLQKFKEAETDVHIVSEYVYCNVCRTLVSTKTCPHGSHHHIKYKAGFMQGLLKAGVLPPAVLIRKELSAIYLTSLFPDRFKELRERYANFFPNDGLIEEMTDEKFYLELMNLHQTSSLT
jgi:sulfate adenylyltransferase